MPCHIFFFNVCMYLYLSNRLLYFVETMIDTWKKKYSCCVCSMCDPSTDQSINWNLFRELRAKSCERENASMGLDSFIAVASLTTQSSNQFLHKHSTDENDLFAIHLIFFNCLHLPSSLRLTSTCRATHRWFCSASFRF